MKYELVRKSSMKISEHVDAEFLQKIESLYNHRFREQNVLLFYVTNFGLRDLIVTTVVANSKFNYTN